MDITPDKQNIERVFSGTQYHIDFYQREYKWSKEQVNILLEDIFHKFNLDYRVDIDAKSENIVSHYSWYYLNTYITNNENGKTFIVDGQQRLTTLTLILIKIFKLFDILSPHHHLQNWVDTKIVGHSADGLSFWLGEEKPLATCNSPLAIDLRHGFYEVDYLPENDRVRYTIHPDARKEILKRLLLLNHEIFEKEAKQGLHKKKDVEAYYKMKGKDVPKSMVFSDVKKKVKKVKVNEKQEKLKL